ncbi:MAG: hypothetical protein WBW73_26315, partial [Rhodoplanes sp.]
GGCTHPLMAAVFAFGKRGANNRAPVSNYLISKGFDFDGVKVGLGPSLPVGCSARTASPAPQPRTSTKMM